MVLHPPTIYKLFATKIYDPYALQDGIHECDPFIPCYYILVMTPVGIYFLKKGEDLSYPDAV